MIVGHGSHLNGDSSWPVYEHAARIRESGEFDEVVECFWKEEPSMRHVLDTVESDDVCVVPAFISEGYFTQQVIPRELGLEGSVNEKGRKDSSIFRAARHVRADGGSYSGARGGSDARQGEASWKNVARSSRAWGRISTRAPEV